MFWHNLLGYVLCLGWRSVCWLRCWLDDVFECWTENESRGVRFYILLIQHTLLMNNTASRHCNNTCVLDCWYAIVSFGSVRDRYIPENPRALTELQYRYLRRSRSSLGGLLPNSNILPHWRLCFKMSLSMFLQYFLNMPLQFQGARDNNLQTILLKKY